VKLEESLRREPGERPPPEGMTVRRPHRPGRPRAEYRPHVQTAGDVEWLRRHRVPAFLLTAEWVSRSGYPVRFQPWLAVPSGLAAKITSDFRLLPVRDPGLLEAPGLAELVTLLLRFDPLAARVVAVRNRGRIDPYELYRRVRNEGAERAATKVRLQELVPELPRVGEPLPLEELEWIEKNNPALPEPA